MLPNEIQLEITSNQNVSYFKLSNENEIKTDLRNKPTNATAGSGYRFLFGNSTSGKNVTERSAMQMTAVYSCVRILAEAVAGLPLHLYRYTDTGGKEKAIDHRCFTMSQILK